MLIEPIRNLFSDIFSFLLVLGGGVIVGLLIFLGLKYTVSGPEKAKELKKWFPWILGGLIIIFLAEFVPVLLRTFFVSSE